MNKTINAAIQLLPKASGRNEYEIIDKAINLIQQSGLEYLVCPFETVVEGDYKSIMTLLEEIQHVSFQEGAESLIINIKLQIANNRDVRISDKMEKY